MRLFGFEITRTKAAVSPLGLGEWNSGPWPIRESFAGAWQRGITVDNQSVLKQSTVWSCVTLIMSDIGKMAVNLIENHDGIWEPIENSAYSPVLREPNHYQTRIKFYEQWIASKLTRGNTYVLKARDNAQRVRKMFVLDPTRVQVLVAPDGSVYYNLSMDNLVGLENAVQVPASEIIHDVGVALFHPLCGLSPLVACGLAALQSLNIQESSAKFFQNNSKPGGVLTAPHQISTETAERIQRNWEANYAGEDNIGKIAVLGDGLTYQATSVNADDAKLVEQLNWSDERICACFHVPAFMVGVGDMPGDQSVERLVLQYYTQCLQSHIESIELCLDLGLSLPSTIGIEFDVEGLYRMDAETKVNMAAAGVKGGLFAPNEARRKYFSLPPVKGGNTPYLQQQNFSLEALSKRDAKADPFATKPSAPAPVSQMPDEDAAAKAFGSLLSESYRSFLLEKQAA